MPSLGPHYSELTKGELKFHATFMRSRQSWLTFEGSPMSNLLFFHRSCAYRHAAAAAFRKARAMPTGSERNAERALARALSELARTEAWLEGQTSHRPEFLRAPVWKPDRSDRCNGRAT